MKIGAPSNRWPEENRAGLTPSGAGAFVESGNHADFTKGAASSRNGRPVAALLATGSSGKLSRIVPHLELGAGAAARIGDVHLLAAGFGVVYMYGTTSSERALSLMGIAHPRFREWLIEQAWKCKYAQRNAFSVSEKAGGRKIDSPGCSRVIGDCGEGESQF